MRAAILLAAGASRRFGRADKLQARIKRRRLIDLALDRALEAVQGRVLLVGPRGVRRRRVTHVRMRKGQPMSRSLAAGLAAVRPIEREVLIFLGDMPFARMPRLRSSSTGVVRPFFGEKPGHPVLVSTRVARAALKRGDQGLGAGVPTIRVPGTRGNILDIDARPDLRMARLHGSATARHRC